MGSLSTVSIADTIIASQIGCDFCRIDDIVCRDPIARIRERDIYDLCSECSECFDRGIDRLPDTLLDPIDEVFPRDTNLYSLQICSFPDFRIKRNWI